MSYNLGTHLIAGLFTKDTDRLEQYDAFKLLVNDLIREHGLQKLGDVYHNFSPSGFTAVVCLSESHLSIHTWPEHGRLNIDIYLSNHLRENDGTVKALYHAIQDHFNAVADNEQIIKR